MSHGRLLASASPHAAGGHGAFPLGSGIRLGKLKALEGPSVTLCLKEGVEGFSTWSVTARLCSLLPLLCCTLSAIQALGSQSQTLPGTFSPYRPAWERGLTALLLKVCPRTAKPPPGSWAVL